MAAKSINGGCGMIDRCIKAGIGWPVIKDEKCEGYTVSEYDDEPHDVCKGCKFLMDGVE